MRHVPISLKVIYAVGISFTVGVAVAFLLHKNYSAAGQAASTVVWAALSLYWMIRFFNLSASITKFFETERKIAEEQAQMSKLLFIPYRTGRMSEKGH